MAVIPLMFGKSVVWIKLDVELIRDLLHFAETTSIFAAKSDR